MVRILHVSDLHVESALADVPLRELASKRFLALVASRLLRSHRFRHARAKIAALRDLVAEEGVDAVVATGDFTLLGTHPELRQASEVVAPLGGVRHGLLAIPGNHDVYLPDAIRDRRFDRYFAPYLASDRPDLATDGRWPIVRFLGDDAVVIAVNSARPNPQPWRSSGRIPEAQLEGLVRALGDAEVRRRFPIVATHYAPRLPNGRKDTLRHGLVNGEALLRALDRGRAGMLIHGHVHRCYALRSPLVPLPIFAAGSTTEDGREGLWLYEVGPRGGSALRGGWERDRYRLDPKTRTAVAWP